MLLHRRELLVRLGFLAMGAAVGCGRRPETALRVGIVVWPGYEPLFLARDLNYLSSAVQLVEYPGSAEVHRSFQNKAIEAACMTLDEALQLAQHQADLRVVLAFSFSNGADALVAKSNITSLPELKGKRIGLEMNGLGAFVLSQALQKAGLTVEEVAPVPLSTTALEEAFVHGTVDAAVTYEPFSGRLQSIGGKVLFDSSEMPGEILDVLVVRAQTLSTHPKALEELMEGWFRALAFSKANQEDAMARGEKRQGLTREELAGTLQRLELLDRRRNIALFELQGGALHDTVRKLGATMKKHRLLENMVNPSTMLHGEILKRAAP